LWNYPKKNSNFYLEEAGVIEAGAVALGAEVMEAGVMEAGAVALGAGAVTIGVVAAGAGNNPPKPKDWVVS
jgi:hypothetical protein